MGVEARGQGHAADAVVLPPDPRAQQQGVAAGEHLQHFAAVRAQVPHDHVHRRREQRVDGRRQGLDPEVGHRLLLPRPDAQLLLDAHALEKGAGGRAGRLEALRQRRVRRSRGVGIEHDHREDLPGRAHGHGEGRPKAGGLRELAPAVGRRGLGEILDPLGPAGAEHASRKIAAAPEPELAAVGAEGEEGILPQRPRGPGLQDGALPRGEPRLAVDEGRGGAQPPQHRGQRLEVSPRAPDGDGDAALQHGALVGLGGGRLPRGDRVRQLRRGEPGIGVFFARSHAGRFYPSRRVAPPRTARARPRASPIGA